MSPWMDVESCPVVRFSAAITRSSSRGNHVRTVVRPNVRMFMRSLRALLVILLSAATLTVVGPVGRAWACTCLEQTTQEHFDGATAVFVGTPTLVADDDPVVWEFAVESIQKGDVRTNQLVDIPRHEVEGCSFNFTEGRIYQVFAGESDEHLATGICSGTTELTSQDGLFLPAGATSREPPPSQEENETTTSASSPADSRPDQQDVPATPSNAAEPEESSTGNSTWLLAVVIGAAGVGAGLSIVLLRRFGQG